MTIKRIAQEETSLKENILAELIAIMGLSGEGQMAIAKRLGYTKDVFSQMKSGYSNGSPQLYAGLLLLKELTVLKQSGVRTNPDFYRELEIMKAKIEEMQRKVSPQYGEHRPDNLTLNTPAGAAQEANLTDRQTAEAAARRAGAVYDKKHGKKRKPS